MFFHVAIAEITSSRWGNDVLAWISRPPCHVARGQSNRNDIRTADEIVETCDRIPLCLPEQPLQVREYPGQSGNQAEVEMAVIARSGQVDDERVNLEIIRVEPFRLTN